VKIYIYYHGSVFHVLPYTWNNLQIDKHMLTQFPFQISPLSSKAVVSVVIYLKILIIDVNTGDAMQTSRFLKLKERFILNLVIQDSTCR